LYHQTGRNKPQIDLITNFKLTKQNKTMEKRLLRNRKNGVVAGVASGLSEYFGIDVTIIRIILVAGIFLPFPVVIPYVIAWAIMPEKKENELVIS
jgi:phage shock protein C